MDWIPALSFMPCAVSRECPGTSASPSSAVQTLQGVFPALSLMSSMTLGTLLHLSMPYFPICKRVTAPVSQGCFIDAVSSYR